MLHTRISASAISVLLQTREAGIALRDRQSLTLTDAEGMELQATQGTLWVTLEGDPEDHILEAGQRLIVRRAGRTVVTAMAGAAALAATRRHAPTLSTVWRNLRARIAHGALLGEPAHLRAMIHE